MVSEAKLQHLLEMRQVLELAYPHTQRYEMKGLHKVGDEILIRATIKRVDEGNIVEEIDVITGCGTGKWNGSAILDVQIDAMIPFSISDRSVINETANARALAAQAPKPTRADGIQFQRREIAPREPMPPIIDPVVAREVLTNVPASAPVTASPEPVSSAVVDAPVPVVPALSIVGGSELGESSTSTATENPTGDAPAVSESSEGVEPGKSDVSSATAGTSQENTLPVAGDPVGEASAAVVEGSTSVTDSTIPAPIPTADLVAPAAKLDI